ncbi:hypothetical protein ACFFNY_30005 [Paenibacillus hodogayensis]|uniref:DUF3221 domain-containing protein n=1 Tax=Paenibacillus hodogayensis TaxID=279208 RepID=A0ABV5W5L0_9BACL
MNFRRLIIVMTFVMLNLGCSNKEPDFMGYVVNRTPEKVTIVEISDKEPPMVLLHQSSKLKIGAKVEVRFKEKNMDTRFPSSTPAEVKEMKENAEVKNMLKHLLSTITERNGPDSYTSRPS